MKTLKDIYILDGRVGLREEAIEWIKAFEDADQKDSDFCINCGVFVNDSDWQKHVDHTKILTSDPYEPHGQEQVATFLKYFFNIKEEELK